MPLDRYRGSTGSLRARRGQAAEQRWARHTREVPARAGGFGEGLGKALDKTWAIADVQHASEGSSASVRRSLRPCSVEGVLGDFTTLWGNVSSAWLAHVIRPGRGTDFAVP